MKQLSPKQKADMLAELLAFMETQDHTLREEWYVSDREMVAKVIERFCAEHLGTPLRLPDVPLQKVGPNVSRQEVLNSLMPHMEDILKGSHDLPKL